MDRRQSMTDVHSMTDARSIDEKSIAKSITSVTEPVPNVAQSVFEADEPAGPVYPTGFKFAMIFAALMTSMFLVALDMTIVATAIPKITSTFASLHDVGWYGSAYFLTLASFQSFWGKTYKNFPLRWSFCAALLIFEVGSVVCGIAPSSTVLIVGRAIQGWGGAGVTGGCYTILANIVPPAKVAPFAGMFGAIYSLASVAGPLMGGVFTDQLTWRWCFYINLPFGGFAIGAIVIFFTTPSGARYSGAPWKEIFLQMDPLGLVAILSALTCYMLALQWGGLMKSWNNSSVIGCFVGWGLLTGAFVVIQAFQKDAWASVNRRILGNKTILACCVYIFFMNATNFLVIYYLPIYFQSVLHVNPSQSGIRNLPLILSGSLMTIVSCSLLRHTRLPKGHIILGSIFLLNGAGFLYTLDKNSETAKYIGYQILFGIGVGTSIQIPMITSQANSKREDIPTVTATVLFFQLISGALSVSAAESIFNNVMHQGLHSIVPNVSVSLVTETGASNLQDVFSGSDLAGVVAAYIQGLEATWLAGVALAAVSLIVAVLAPIGRAAKPPKPTPEVVPATAAPGTAGGESERTGTSGQEDGKESEEKDRRDLVSRDSVV